MKQRRRKKREQTKARSARVFFHCIKAALAGCVLSVLLLLLLALLLKWELLGEESISLATTVIKALAAAASGILCANACATRGWLWGGVSGTIYVLLAFLSFALVERAFSPSLAILADIALGLTAGCVGGMLVRAKQT